MSVEDDLRAVNDAFYRAFRERDLDAMDRLWASDAPVACVHPGMLMIIGRDAVMRSWRGILRHPNAPFLSASHVQGHVLGTSGFVTCLAGKPGQPPRLVTTNVFTLEQGRWRLVHHHAAPLAPSATPKAGSSEEVDPYSLN